MRAGGIQGVSVFPSQFCCKSKTALKIQSPIKNYFRKWIGNPKYSNKNGDFCNLPYETVPGT